MVSLRELAEWIEKIDDNYYKKDSKEQFAKTDTDKDGFVNLNEYFASMGLDGMCIGLYVHACVNDIGRERSFHKSQGVIK